MTRMLAWRSDRRQCALSSRAWRFAGSRLRPRAERGSGKRSRRRQKLPARMAESPCRELVQRTRQRQSNRRTTPAGKTCRSGNPWHCGPDAMTRSPRMTRRRKSFRSNSGRPPMRPATVGRRTIVAGAHNQEASASPYRRRLSSHKAAVTSQDCLSFPACHCDWRTRMGKNTIRANEPTIPIVQQVRQEFTPNPGAEQEDRKVEFRAYEPDA